MLQKTFFLFLLLLITSCSSLYPNQHPVGKKFPTISGNSLDGKKWSLPLDFGEEVILLLGYKQDSQFDIDRWLIALDQTKTNIKAYEIPTIQGMFPRMFQTKIDSGMRRGIPKELWGAVITVYKDGEKVQRFTGNTNPLNSRVLLLDKEGDIIYFYDRGFSTLALNKLREKIKKVRETK